MELEKWPAGEDGFQDGTEFGSICWQPGEQKIWDVVYTKSGRGIMRKRKLEAYNMSEDCLTLNIYVPLVIIRFLVKIIIWKAHYEDQNLLSIHCCYLRIRVRFIIRHVEENTPSFPLFQGKVKIYALRLATKSNFRSNGLVFRMRFP
jgi:hypothetical protein